MESTPHPPGPRGHFLLGNLPEFWRDPLGTAIRWGNDYGDIVRVRFAHVRGYYLNHPDYIEYIFLTNHRNFIKGRAFQASRALWGNGLLTSEGDFWLHQRRMTQPIFHRDRVTAYGQVMVERTQEMLASWQDGQTRDLFQEMLRLTMENAAETLFGADVREHTADVAGAIQVVLEDQASLRGVYRLPSLIPTARDRRYRQAIQRLDDIIYGIIRRRRESGRDTGDLLSLLLDAQDEDGRRMTDRQLRDEAMTIFVAGHETTAICLAWTWYLLGQHPDVEARLVAELQSVLGGRAPDAADLSRLPYTERVVLESLRLYPPVWGVTRIVLQDCEIGDYRVPAGASVAICQYAMHRDPRYFDDPLTFDPDRWDGDLAKRLPRYAYFPFGGGARLCIGKAFGMMEAMLVLATVAQRFQLALVPDHPVTPWPSLTLRPRHGIQVVPARRPGAPSGRGIQASRRSGVQEAGADEVVPASPNA